MKPLLLVITLLLLGAVCLATLFIGPVEISIARCWREYWQGESDGYSHLTIMLQLRLPRMVGAVVVGAALGVAGVAFQALFRNPLADPYIVGASSGAALGVTIAIAAGLSFTWFGLRAVSCGALAGSVSLTAVVLMIGIAARSSSSTTLLLAGVALSSMTNSLVSLLMFLSDEKVMMIVAWLMGSLALCDWPSVATTTVLASFGALLICCLMRPLDAYLLGDGAAESLGIDLVKFRCLLVLGGGVLTAASVTTGGVIGFTGLIAPHIARWLTGPSHRWLLPMSALTGALLLVVADTIARTIVAPVELPVGVVTALMGCPVFLFLLMRQSGRPGFNGAPA